MDFFNSNPVKVGSEIDIQLVQPNLRFATLETLEDLYSSQITTFIQSLPILSNIQEGKLFLKSFIQELLKILIL